MAKCDRVLFCAPSSGGGKTTVVCAILQALVDADKKPVAFKCGPDYIDPMFHSEVIGARSRNLDSFFLGDEKVKYLLAENGKKGGISIIEGVMGYYDGVAMSDSRSAWELANITETPAVLVVDGRGRALSVAAMVKGFLSFRENSGIKGVILNRIPPMMYESLKAVIERECAVRVYGFLPECKEASLESRHLGLVTAAEVVDLRSKLKILAKLANEHIDLKGLSELAASAPELEVTAPKLPKSLDKKIKIAVAKDRAFCFYYADGFELLERLGAEIVEFSPLHDESVPSDCAGLYIGGGYPELYAGALSENKKMLASIKAAIDSGMPTIAECGGFLYLHDSLEGEDGSTYHMAGVIHAHAFRTQRLSRFGYITMKAQTDGLLGAVGTEIPAHEFHYWDSSEPGGAFHAKKPLSERNWNCAYMNETMYAGFPHFHFWSVPETLKSFLIKCEAYAYKA